MKRAIYTITASVLCLLILVGGAACVPRGYATTPDTSSALKGRDYMSVSLLFMRKGFKDIRLERMDDLTEDDKSLEGKVEDVSIAGDTDYLPNKWVPEDSQIVIRYHNCPVVYTLPGMITKPVLPSADRAALEQEMLATLQKNFVDFKVSFDAGSKAYEFVPTGGDTFMANYSAAVEGTKAQRDSWVAFAESMQRLSVRLSEALGSGYSFKVYDPEKEYTIFMVSDGYVFLDYVK